MSFILEALRRADAQREADPARGIHARPLPPRDDDDSDDDSAASARAPLARRLLPWAVVLVLVLAALVAWRELRPHEAVTRWAERVAPLEARAVRVQAGPEGSAGPAHAILPPPEADPPARRTARAPAGVPVAAPAVVPAAARAAAGTGSPVASRGASPPATSAETPAAVRSAAPGRGLPDDAPRLAITGGVHSANAAQRMLVVNGQVVGEGAEPAPGLQVEEIGAGAAVLRWRGRRYQVGY